MVLVTAKPAAMIVINRLAVGFVMTCSM